MRSARVLVAVLTILSPVASCKSPTKDSKPSPAAVRGNAERGKALVAQYECTRCHAVEGVEAPPKDKQCTGCHHDINSGAITTATQEQKARWQSKVAELGDVPSLIATSSRLRGQWIRGFLLHPRDLRPALQPTMPRLNLDEAQARDIAAFLSPSDDEPASAAAALAGANAARGRELMDVKGCGLCHQMTGVAAIRPGMLPTGVTISDMARAIRLAPDLRFTRDRWRPSLLVGWLQDPPKVKADTLMPSMGLTPDEAKSIAAYVLQTPLAPVTPPATPQRLAALDRKVTYDEVATRVLRKTCWHCHGEPDFERGDGGPGNSGGFGFQGRGLNLSDYPATFAGYLDDTGQRTSVFTPTADGTPFIVAAMLARQKEEAGEEGALRGMPLGLPALPPEDVQLVDTWIAQGRQR